jgi:phytoene/squalene synthetase
MNLLGSRNQPEPEEPREEHPGAGWRADSLAQSRHSRLDAAPEPLVETDPERAAALCAALCRETLGDFAPALLLLPAAERARLQALIAYLHALFDFARDQGIEGERLAQINRWQFALESALEGEPSGQPVFLVMAREHARRAWPAGALDRLAACARLRVTQPQAATVEELDRRARELAAAVGEALFGSPLDGELAEIGGALVRLHALQHLGATLTRNRWPLAETELPAREAEPAKLPAETVVPAVARESERLRPLLLDAPRALAGLDPGSRRAALFALLAARALLTQIQHAGPTLLTRPPRLGLAARLGLLLRARSRLR